MTGGARGPRLDDNGGAPASPIRRSGVHRMTTSSGDVFQNEQGSAGSGGNQFNEQASAGGSGGIFQNEQASGGSGVNQFNEQASTDGRGGDIFQNEQGAGRGDNQFNEQA